MEQIYTEINPLQKNYHGCYIYVGWSFNSGTDFFFPGKL